MFSSALQLINRFKACPLGGYNQSCVTTYSAHFKYNRFCGKAALVEKQLMHGGSGSVRREQARQETSLFSKGMRWPCRVRRAFRFTHSHGGRRRAAGGGGALCEQACAEPPRGEYAGRGSLGRVGDAERGRGRPQSPQCLPESLSGGSVLFSSQWEPSLSTDMKMAPHYCRVIKGILCVAPDSSQNSILLFSC